MGHFRIRKVPASGVGRDATIGVRMQRAPEPEVIERGRREFDQPPCISDWDGWNITSDQVSPVPGLPVSYFISPTSASVLCEDECLEWVMETTCPDSNVTIEPAEDCVGVTVTFDDGGDTELLLGCIATLNAFVVGSATPFGTTINLLPFPDQTFLYGDEPGFLGTDLENWSESIACDAAWSGETWIVTSPLVENYVPSLFAWNATQSGSDFTIVEDFDLDGRPRILVAPNLPPEDMCGQSVTCNPTYDGAPVNGPLEWRYE